MIWPAALAFWRGMRTALRAQASAAGNLRTVANATEQHPTLAQRARTMAETDIVHERKRQDSLWGEQNHGPEVWLVILLEEVGELSEEILKQRYPAAHEPTEHPWWKQVWRWIRGYPPQPPATWDYDDLLAEAVQAGAVLRAFIEYLHRQRLRSRP